MALSETAQFPAALSQITGLNLSAANQDTTDKEHGNVHDRIFNEFVAIQAWASIIAPDAIVAPSGGDYTSVATACSTEAENAIILIKAGTYTESGSITVKSGQKLIGEGRGKTIILLNGAYQISIQGTQRTAAGTVTVTNGSATLTGASTTFSTDGVIAGDYVMVYDGNNSPIHLSKVVSVGSNTSLTMLTPYHGATAATSSYMVVTAKANCLLKDFTVYNTTDTSAVIVTLRTINFRAQGLEIYSTASSGSNNRGFYESGYDFNFTLEDVHVHSVKSHGFQFSVSFGLNVAKDCSAIGCAGTGFYTAGGGVYQNCVAISNAIGGIRLAGGVPGGISNCRSFKNGGYGFEISSSMCYSVGCYARGNVGDGFKVNANDSFIEGAHADSNTGAGFNIINDRCYISGRAMSNTSYGFLLPAGADNNQIVGLSYSNTAGHISDAGTGNTTTGVKQV